jgi:hypothetical protein
MRRAAPILLTFAVLLFTATEGFALPACPEDQDERYHNCYGTYTWVDGDKYVGEFRNDALHGYGTYTFAAKAVAKRLNMAVASRLQRFMKTSLGSMVKPD